MNLSKRIEEAKRVIESEKEDGRFDEAERDEQLLRFARFYLSTGKRYTAAYRLNKILDR